MPDCGAYEPGGQLSHASWLTLGTEPLGQMVEQVERIPFMTCGPVHNSQAVPFWEAKCPDGHAAQAELPGSSATRPSAQGRHSETAVAPCWLRNVPAGQGRQSSAREAPDRSDQVPAGQRTQPRAEPKPVTSLYEPAEQFVHESEPESENWPARQGVQSAVEIDA